MFKKFLFILMLALSITPFVNTQQAAERVIRYDAVDGPPAGRDTYTYASMGSFEQAIMHQKDLKDKDGLTDRVLKAFSNYLSTEFTIDGSASSFRTQLGELITKDLSSEIGVQDVVIGLWAESDRNLSAYDVNLNAKLNVVPDNYIIGPLNQYALTTTKETNTLSQKEAQALNGKLDTLAKLAGVIGVDGNNDQVSVYPIQDENLTNLVKGQVGSHEITFGIKSSNGEKTQSNNTPSFVVKTNIEVSDDKLPLLNEVDNTGSITTDELFGPMTTKHFLKSFYEVYESDDVTAENSEPTVSAESTPVATGNTHKGVNTGVASTVLFSVIIIGASALIIRKINKK